ncbi:sigma-70 family RNA polymerase sigma factor [Paenibacillus terrae]|uniref:Sigma-70 family RNA polymerase sigma factor n=2 Tax=Paenibacillus terrae TaxID=159743 RepID=A0A4U2Q1Z4_9BACL|nr:sigma-70 family RNA polymerase sigma factor [Paenibacillus terrae]
MPTTMVTDCCEGDQCTRQYNCFYNQICELYLDDVYRFCIHLLKNELQFRCIAEECTQDTFLTARQQLCKLKLHPNVKGWLYLTAKHFVHKSLRRYYTQKKHETMFEHEACSLSISVEEDWEKSRFQDIDQIINSILTQLSKKEYELYQDYFLQNMSISILATKYNISITATTTRIYRLRKTLRTLSHQYYLTHM